MADMGQGDINGRSLAEFPRNTAASAATGNEIDRGSPPGAAALRCSRFGRLLVECIHPVSAPPYGRREPRRGSAISTRMVSTGSVGTIPSGISDIPAPARVRPNTGARLSASGLLNEVEYRCLLLCVEPIPCLREPNTALGP